MIKEQRAYAISFSTCICLNMPDTALVKGATKSEPFYFIGSQCWN
jgi:hypothetical protein